MSSDNSSPKLVLDSPEDYKDWSREIVALCLRKGCYDVLEGTEKKPDASETAEVVKWTTSSRWIAGTIIQSTGKNAAVHLDDSFDGPTYWKALKKAYATSTSALRFNALSALLNTKQEGHSIIDLLGTIDQRWNAWKSTHPDSAYDLNKLCEEIYCWAFIRALDGKFGDLKIALLKEADLTKDRCIQLTHQLQQGLQGDSSVQNAFIAQPASSAIVSNAVLTSAPCYWCVSKGRTAVAAGHSLGSCTGFAASIDNNRKFAASGGSNAKGKQSTRPQRAQQAVEQVQEFAGTASHSLPHDSMPSDEFWVTDSGATSSMTGIRQFVHDLKPWRVPIRLGDNTVIYSEGIGKVWFEPVLAGHAAPLVCFTSVLYVPRLKSNLLSITFLSSQRGYQVTFSGPTISFVKNGTVLFDATINQQRIGKLNGRTLPAISVPTPSLHAALKATDIGLWHQRFAHRSHRMVKHAIKHSVDGAQITSNAEPPKMCIPCLAGHQSRFPFHPSIHEADRPMQIIYCDLRGPFHVQTFAKKLYWAVFTDSKTRWRHLALLSSKRSEELLQHYKFFEAQGKAQHGQDASVVIFRCDGGGEFIGALKQYLFTQGTRYQETTRNTPQQNGISERANRDIGEGIVSLLTQSGLPDQWWGEAALAFVHVTNRFPVAALGDKTPYELFYGHRPDVSHFRVWGCKAYVHVQRDQRTKTDPHTVECAFVGYPDDHKAWRFYDPKSRKVILSRDAVFDETSFFYPPRVGAPPPALAPKPDYKTLRKFLDDDDSDEPPPGGAPVLAHIPVPAPAPAVPGTPPPVAAPFPPPVTPPRPATPPLPPLALRRPQRKRKFPVEHWKVNPPIHYHDDEDPPSPSPAPSSSTVAPEPLALPPPVALPAPVPPPVLEPIDEGESDSSDDPLQFSGSAEVESALLASVGISQDSVVLEFDEALEYAYSGVAGDEPTFQQAMNGPDKAKWMQACLDEIEAHTQNGTWQWVVLPPEAKPIGSRFVLKVKRTEDGSVERYKARLVAQGFSQRPGWDFLESFAPTIRMAVVRAILAIVAAEDLECESVDITTAFLNGDLDETIYMRPPPGFEKFSPEGQRLYCLLLKAIYGLKQGGRQWYLKLSEVMKSIGFRKLRSEPCVYVFERDGERIIVPSYVDDLHIVAKTKDAIARVKQQLAQHFKLRDLGDTKFFLGIHITRDRTNQTLSLSQRQYCEDMLREFNMLECNPVKTPMLPGLKLSINDCPQNDEDRAFMKDKPYLRAVGKLNYLALATRPDISFAVSTLARFGANPGPNHWAAVKHLLKYIKGTMDYKITYGPSPHPTAFLSFSDADYAGDQDKARSTSGWVILMGGGAVSWSSKLQTRTAESTTEAEYISGESVTREMAFFRWILEDLGYKLDLPRPLGMDNQSAIAAAKNPEHQGRMKHMNPIYHAFRDRVELKEVSPYYISTSSMPADILTKPLHRDKVKTCCDLMGIGV